MQGQLTDTLIERATFFLKNSYMEPDTNTEVNREILGDFVEARVGVQALRQISLLRRSSQYIDQYVGKKLKNKAWLRFNLAHRMGARKHISLTDPKLRQRNGDRVSKELRDFLP